MTYARIIDQVKSFCKTSSGDEQIWNGNNGTYHWNIGKTTSDGTTNGVVRKLAGIDVSGKQIWVVAGSLKITEDGRILRFTGMPKKFTKHFVVGTPVEHTDDSTRDTITV